MALDFYTISHNNHGVKDFVRNGTIMDEPKKRGRPRRYDPQAALEKARDVFWSAGYSASSLDDLSAATAMNRPSLYGAFGDKEALYLKTLEGYRDLGIDGMRQALAPARTLRQGLATVYEMALEIYLGDVQRGCFLIGTAAVEAVTHNAIAALLLGSLKDFDREFEKRFRLAVESGEISRDADSTALALLASAVMHSLAVRARAGESRDVLETIARAGVAMILKGAAAD
jgi:AcrR family transcriptional regulator